MLEECKLALVMDNCTAHHNIENLKSATLYFLPPNITSCLQPMDQRVIRSMKCKYRSRIIQKIIRAIDNGKQIPSFFVFETVKILVLSWSEVSETTIINCFRKASFKEGMRDEDDGPFSALKSSIDQLRQRDENLVPNDFICEDMLKVDGNIAVIEGVMTEEEIVQDIIEVAEEEVQEEDEKDIDETLTKSTTEEICKAIDALVNFLMIN